MEARRLTEKALRESEEALVRAQRVAKVGSWEHDLSSDQVSWSEEMYRIAGREPGVPLPGRDSLLELVVAEDRDRVSAALAKAREKEHPYSLAYAIHDSSGRKRDVNEIVEVLRDKDSASGRLVGTVQDITEMRILEAQMIQAQKLESLGVVAGGIAHEFNNILAGIMGYTELLLYRKGLDPMVREDMQKIMDLGQRAANISQQMLAYSGKSFSRSRALDISEMVREMAALLDATLPKKARLHLDLAPGLPAMVADPSQLSQMILNLINNASEALSDSGGDITLRTGRVTMSEAELRTSFLFENQPAGEYLFLEVRDTGQGIEQESLDKVFDPFFTTKFTGRGLGLAVVLGIVRALDGALAVSSRPGEGSSFKLMFPIASHLVAPEKKVTVPVFSHATKSGTILLIDDDDPVREVAAKILEEAGHKVITAPNGGEGLDRFRANVNNLDLVILDMTMPDINGDEVYPIMVKERPDIKILLASGYSLDSIEDRIPQKSLAGFLQKPWQKQELLTAVESFLD